MNWPGSGDPYYTAEGGVRRTWYGVTWVPWLVGDGEFVNTDIGSVNAKFNESIAQPGLLDIASTHSLDGTVMNITTNVLPFANFSNFKIVINVFEYLTTENASTNGETEFENVMMKMVPDANGTNTDLTDRVPYTIQQSVNLSGTNVEEWEDLGVMVIIQDNADKVVYQSAYSMEDMVYATDATLSMLTYDGMEVPDFSPDVYEYTVVLPMGTVEVPVVEGTLNDENGIAIVVPALELPGATTVDVFAQDRSTKSTYTINFEVNTTGINPKGTKAINVYPNPTSGKVFISGAENATIEIFNLTGAIVASYSDFSNNVIDLSNMEQGIYFLNIIIDNKTVLNKKVSLLK
ncbi:MAG: T9SS type A sorting domain-containing protein [Bacteroidales bacterium]|nr:T9SS type A sorting domain-containing protein [Bacteroidales bacterium]